MDDVLRHRIDALHRRELTIFSIVFAALGLAAALMTATTRSIARQLVSLTVAIKTIVNDDIAGLALTLGRLAGGDLSARFASNRPALQATGSDEIAELGLVAKFTLDGPGPAAVPARFTAVQREAIPARR
jgi:hypothetical protein